MKTQIIKQADVVMLLYLLPERFKLAEKAKNYLYYVKRTLHKSSLSPSIYSILASEVGDATRAYLYFLFSLYADLKNTHGNTREGIHAANLGGTWQAVIMGFAGFRIIDDMPSFEPRLPGHWRAITFHMKWKGHELKLSISNKKITVFASTGSAAGTRKQKVSLSRTRKRYILFKAFNSVYKVPFNKNYIIRK